MQDLSVVYPAVAPFPIFSVCARNAGYCDSLSFSLIHLMKLLAKIPLSYFSHG